MAEIFDYDYEQRTRDFTVSTMRVCAISFKECWQEADQRWYSYGGFPLQMAGIASLFEQMTLLVVRGEARPGGIPLPAQIQVVPMRAPVGSDARRKLSVLRHLPYYLRLFSHYCREADVVHVPVPGDLPLVGLLIALCLGKRVVARYGGSWEANSETTWVNRFTRLLMRRTAGGRNVMLATGDGATPPAARMHWVFSTAITQAELAAVQPDLDRPASFPIQFIYAGRLSPEKGLVDLISALRRLHHEDQLHPGQFQLTLVGDGPQKEQLQALVTEAQCQALVHFAGQLDRQDLIALLCQKDIFVLPSRTEGFSKARLDALLCGVPLLTTLVGFGAEVVGEPGERGWLVEVGNVAGLAKTMRKLIHETQDWPALRRRCRDYVAHRTLEAWARDIGRICAQQWDWQYTEGKLQNRVTS